MQWHADSEAWLRKHQLWPPENEHPDWGFAVKMSTQPVWDWTVRRSHIPADAVWLGLQVHRVIGWMATVYTRDKRFMVQWRASGATVDSQQLRYRRMTAWPAMVDLDAFPSLVIELEKLLSIRFGPCAHIEAYSLDVGNVETLRHWLKPCCEVVDLTVMRLDGALPPRLANCMVSGECKAPAYQFRLPTSEFDPRAASE